MEKDEFIEEIKKLEEGNVYVIKSGRPEEVLDMLSTLFNETKKDLFFFTILPGMELKEISEEELQDALEFKKEKGDQE